MRILPPASNSTLNLSSQAQTNPSDGVFQALLASVSNDQPVVAGAQGANTSNSDATGLEAKTDFEANYSQDTALLATQAGNSTSGSVSDLSLSTEATPLMNTPRKGEPVRHQVSAGSPRATKPEASRAEVTGSSVSKTSPLATITLIAASSVQLSPFFSTYQIPSISSDLVNSSFVSTSPLNTAIGLVSNDVNNTPVPASGSNSGASIVEDASQSQQGNSPLTSVSSNIVPTLRGTQANYDAATPQTVSSSISVAPTNVTPAGVAPHNKIPVNAVSMNEVSVGKIQTFFANTTLMANPVKLVSATTEQSDVTLPTRSDASASSTPTIPAGSIGSTASTTSLQWGSNVTAQTAPHNSQSVPEPMTQGASATPILSHLKTTAALLNQTVVNISQPVANTTVANTTQWDNSNTIDHPAGIQSDDSTTPNNNPNWSSNTDASTVNTVVIDLLQAIPQQTSFSPESGSSDASRIAVSPKPLAPVTSPIVTGDRNTDASSASTSSPIGPSSAVSPATPQTTASILPLPVNLPATTVVTKSSDATQSSIQPASKPSMKKDAANAANSGNSDLKSSANSSTDKNADTANSSHDASASNHGSQSNGQTQKDSSANASSIANVSPATGSNTSQQQQPSVAPVVAHDSATTHNAVAVVDTPGRIADNRDVQLSVHGENIEAPAASNIDSAKILQTMSESEMRVGMHSSEFGNISIRTTISQQQMLTQISLDHGDLSHAISSHLSTVQTRLGNEHGLNASIEVNNQSAASAADSGQSSSREQKGFASSSVSRSIADMEETGKGTDTAVLLNTDNGHRLDIRA